MMHGCFCSMPILISVLFSHFIGFEDALIRAIVRVELSFMGGCAGEGEGANDEFGRFCGRGAIPRGFGLLSAFGVSPGFVRGERKLVTSGKLFFLC